MRAQTLSSAIGAVLMLSLLAACGDASDPVNGRMAVENTASGNAAVGDPAAAPAASTGGSARIWTKAATPPSVAQWSAVIGLSLVPAAAANLPDGRILFWSAEERFSFSARGRTYTTLFDPATRTNTQRLVSETGHDMFCPGTTNLPDGSLLISGGIDSEKTSRYDPATGTWSRASNMTLARGYQANTLTALGEVFTLGGSWSGGVGNKHGELWTPEGGWRRLTGVPVDPALGESNEGPYRTDNHMWLFATGDQRIFHAGPSAKMNWITTRGNGSIASAGVRGDDGYSMSGNAAMFDIDRILKTGGSSGYTDAPSNRNSYVIELGENAVVSKLAPMAYARAFHNSVVLPNGQVVIVGGQTWAKNFDDNNSVLVPELWDPATRTFSPMPPMSVPRNYHSVALLMPDGRVVAAGGGLCGNGCAANHPDLQILTPPYLLNANGTEATRPVITQAPGQATLGSTISVNTGAAVASFVLMRMSSVTHTVNNDQRRVPLTHQSANATTHTVAIPSNPGIALPGYYMLFALDGNGVPSVSRAIRIHADGLPSVINPGKQTHGQFTDVDVQVASIGGGTFSATGLPPGLGIDATTGAITGRAATAGEWRATVTTRGTAGATSSDFSWTIQAQAGPGTAAAIPTARYIRLEALAEIRGNPWASAAEIDVLDAAGNAMSRTGWTATADSAETAQENGNAANVLDGNPATIWHTAWSAGNAPMPHWLQIDMRSERPVGGIRYLPRSGGGNGTIARFRISTSIDGTNWTTPAEDDFLRWATDAGATKTVLFGNVARGRPATQSSNGDGTSAARAVDGNIDGAMALGSVTSTTSQANPWWQVDLGSARTLGLIRLWNRTDCCAERLNNLVVFVSADDMTGRSHADLLADASIWRYQIGGVAGRETLIQGTSRGRFLRVQLAGTGVLSLAEVEAYGPVGTPRAPVIQTPADIISDLGKAASLTLSASDPDGDPIRFSATGLPAGLAIDPASGRISGTPTAIGSSVARVTVTDGGGLSASTGFSWVVVEPAMLGAPIVAPPAAAGTAVPFTLPEAANGVTLYSWDFGDGSAATAFSTATSTAHRYAVGGLYAVTVTARNPGGATQTYRFTQAVYTPANGSGRPVASSNIAYEARGTGRVWVVNQDNDSVSVFNAATRARIAEIAVGSQPRTIAIANDGSLWVTNKGAATLSVISPTTLAITRTVTLPRGAQPFGVVMSPADGSAWVALEATGDVLKLNGTTGAQLGRIGVGPAPRHLSMTADGSRLLVSRFVTPPLPGEHTTTVQTRQSGADRGGEVVVVNAASLATERTVVLKVSTLADSTIQGRGVPNYLGAAVIRPDGSSAWVPSKQDNVQRGLARDGLQLDFQNSVRAIVSRIDLATMTEDHARRGDLDNAGLGSAAVFDPTGSYLFVALETSRQVAVVDPGSGREHFRFDVGRAPQGLAISPDGQTLFVNNFMDRTVSAHDLRPLTRNGLAQAPQLASTNAITTEKLTAEVLKGKQFFYDARDPRLARDAYLSCASCHSEGGADGRTWDFTGFGEGLRNTISLRGRGGMGNGPLHWSANFDEGQDFEGQIRGFAGGTGLMTDAQFTAGTRRLPLGDRKAGINADLDALAAYMASLTPLAASPLRTASGTLTTDGQAGQTLFAQKGCVTCHSGTLLSDSGAGRVHDIGSLKPASGSRLGSALNGIDTPPLRELWATAPYLHDGSAATLDAAIRAHVTIALTGDEIGKLAAFLGQMGNEAAQLSRQFRYLRLQALSEINGNPWASMAELNVLDDAGRVLSRSGWTASANSAESRSENGRAQHVLDGNTATIWHTQYTPSVMPLPHTLTIDMKALRAVSAIRYLPRQSGAVNGTIARYRVTGSIDGTTWSAPLAEGDFSQLSGPRVEKTVPLR